MSAHYTAKSRPLTLYERELLDVLIEECSEVIKAACKMLRFGPDEGYPGGSTTNKDDLGMELGEVMHMISRLQGACLIDSKKLSEGMANKSVKLSVYLQHASDSR